MQLAPVGETKPQGVVTGALTIVRDPRKGPSRAMLIHALTSAADLVLCDLPGELSDAQEDALRSTLASFALVVPATLDGSDPPFALLPALDATADPFDAVRVRAAATMLGLAGLAGRAEIKADQMVAWWDALGPVEEAFTAACGGQAAKTPLTAVWADDIVGTLDTLPGSGLAGVAKAIEDWAASTTFGARNKAGVLTKAGVDASAWPTYLSLTDAATEQDLAAARDALESVIRSVIDQPLAPWGPASDLELRLVTLLTDGAAVGVKKLGNPPGRPEALAWYRAADEGKITTSAVGVLDAVAADADFGATVQDLAAKLADQLRGGEDQTPGDIGAHFVAATWPMWTLEDNPLGVRTQVSDQRKLDGQPPVVEVDTVADDGALVVVAPQTETKRSVKTWVLGGLGLAGAAAAVYALMRGRRG